MPPVTPAATHAMRPALTVLLDGAKGSRDVFRHLAAVEYDLGRKDGQGRFLFDVPSSRLGIVLRQLNGLIGDSTPAAGLAELRACLKDAITAREQVDLRVDKRQPISTFLVDEKLQVSEVRQSEFDAVQAAWGGPPQPVLPKS